MKTTNRCLLFFGLLGGVLALQNCAPIFSEMQDARLVGKGNKEVSPYYTSTSFSSDEESGGIQNQIGTQAAFGLSEKVDLRMRLEYVWGKGDDSFTDVIFGIGPKVSLIKDRVAAYLPVGFSLGGISQTFQIHPTMLFTLPVVKDKIDFNPSVKYLIATCDDCDNNVAVNFGFAFSNDIRKWAVRTEYGMLYNPGEEGHFGQFSLGLNYKFMKKRVN